LQCPFHKWDTPANPYHYWVLKSWHPGYLPTDPKLKSEPKASQRQRVERWVAQTSSIEQYQPDVLSIKMLHPSRTSPNLNQLVNRIKELSRRKGLKVYQYSIKELEDFFYPEGRINKRQLAEIIASRYTILSHELKREKAHRNPYHIRMFEAVALGSICLHRLEKYAKE